MNGIPRPLAEYAILTPSVVVAYWVVRSMVRLFYGRTAIK
jgi:hypothetical protein